MKICRPGRSLCLLSITGLAELEGQYHSLSGTYFSATKHVTVCFQPSQADRRTASLVYVNIRSLVLAIIGCAQLCLWNPISLNDRTLIYDKREEYHVLFCRMVRVHPRRPGNREERGGSQIRRQKKRVGLC